MKAIRIWGYRLNHAWTFDTFIVGPANKQAFNAARVVAHAPGSCHNPLYIYGQQGLGSTHLMQAIAHNITATSRASLGYVPAEAMLDEYINALQNRALAQFRNKYLNVDVLLIDDIQYFALKIPLPEEFAAIFIALLDARKQIVMTSDRPPGKMPGFEKKLLSRFKCGLTVALKSPDLKTRIAILRQKLKQRNNALSDECVLYIARHCQSNIRCLEGDLIRAIAYASLHGQKMTLATLKHLL